MGIVTAISSLSREIQERCRLFLSRCASAGLPVAINETYRDRTTQMIYYMQGRLDVHNNKNIVAEFNALRKQYGLWEIPAEDALSKVITWTLYSKHMEGKAFDAVPTKNGKAWWNAPNDVWLKMGTIGESVGLSWGGRWPDRKKDSPHFEIP